MTVLMQLTEMKLGDILKMRSGILFSLDQYLQHYEVTSNVTGRHQGPKQKLCAGYRVPSLQWTGWLQSAITKMHIML